MSRVIVGIISRKNSDNQDEYLLIRARKEFGEYTGFYYPPGGHLEIGEDKEQALKREIREELNLDIEPLEELDETPSDVEGQTTYWWLCKYKGGDINADTEEIADAQFFQKEAIQKLNLWPATKQFFDKHIFKI